jgi:hypothetical protein
MAALTRREWETRVLAAYNSNHCPHCGMNHRAVNVDYWGAVWFYCPNSEKEYYAGTEEVPPYFAPDPASADDLPA